MNSSSLTPASEGKEEVAARENDRGVDLDDIQETVDPHSKAA
jgi:hypothetical protein